MERDLVNVDESYVLARVIEAINDSILAIDLFKKGITRNSAGKAFSSVKLLLSALVVRYEGKLIELGSNEEKTWLRTKGHLVPTYSMKMLSNYFKRIGINIDILVEKALDLHEYQYNGFEPDFSRYRRKEDVKADLVEVVSQIPELVEKYFSDIREREVELLAERLKEELKSLS
ncbi:hypothetical protein L3N51_01998 [Metallosphaera sp. J1]|uniref:PaREP1 family protein n=1 Tax=Metallosphaera javensis (ex Hofmann et al. 2022) TaxID=99938 RepID=UPI001EDFE0BC|nr:PaREP1 family protein [Metallosphaera javensis (ex Hofmann et al. 2022)]MCG3109703.1 hypothetical protein [Metallosphaera javensis (ex Hofmann et al. 2022)]